MKRRISSFSLILQLALAALLSPLTLSAEMTQTQVGIDEKLGQTIPLELTFKDEESNDVSLRELMQNKPTLLLLVFYRCQGICTPLLNGVADAIKRSTSLDPGKEFQIITISFDAQDTPEVARGKRNNYLKLIGRPIDPSGWRFLTGNQDNIDKICNAIGFRYLTNEGAFVHVGAVTFLSGSGKIVRYLYGSEPIRDVVPILPFEVEMGLSEASAGRIGTSVHKALRLCFQYDQASKRYVLDVTRIAMVLVLLFAVSLVLYVTVFCKIGHAPEYLSGSGASKAKESNHE